MADAVDHPKHYNEHPSGVECIDIVEHMTFNSGNAVKYIWRAGIKSKDQIEDLKKAAWYIAREIGRIEKQSTSGAEVTDRKTATTPEVGEACGHEINTAGCVRCAFIRSINESR